VCPTLGAVQLPVSIIKAGGCEEEGFVRYEIINTDVMRCLQCALTFHRSDSLRCKAWGGSATLGGQRNTSHALHWRTVSGISLREINLQLWDIGDLFTIAQCVK